MLVKALPQPSKTYGETVCCAGVTVDGHWKRLFPVRFRHLSGDNSFSRWDWVRFGYREPTRDKRAESCHVYEDSLSVESNPLPISERSRLLSPLITGSALEAMQQLEPSPFDFRFQFEDSAGRHDYQNGDWETHVTFWRWREQYGEASALSKMSTVFNDDYPARGMVFALGNQAKRPQTWQLLGVIRLDELKQADLFG